MPWVSDFLELNVRTYVKDERGVPGVWFYSLSCNQPMAVWLARRFFHLNYVHAKMDAHAMGRAFITGVNGVTSRRHSFITDPVGLFWSQNGAPWSFS